MSGKGLEPTFAVLYGEDGAPSLVPCLGPKCSPSRADLTPKPSRPTAVPTRGGGGADQKADERKRKDAEARQRPGGPGRKKPRTRAVPAPPNVSAPRPTRTRTSSSSGSWGAPVALTLAGLLVVGLVARVVVAVADVLTEAWRALVDTLATIQAVIEAAALPLAAVSVAVLLAVTVDWRHVRAWAAVRRRQADELAARRAEWAELVEADRAPIALGPVTEPVRTAEGDELMRAWTDPQRAVEDFHHLYAVRRKEQR